MACTLSNKCAKNVSKRTVPLQLIIKNVVTCFLEHSVVALGIMFGRKQVNKKKIPKTLGIFSRSFLRSRPRSYGLPAGANIFRKIRRLSKAGVLQTEEKATSIVERYNLKFG